jgi:hypothetical protein
MCNKKHMHVFISTSVKQVRTGRSKNRNYFEYKGIRFGGWGPVGAMAAELVDIPAILVAVRRFLGMGVADSRSLRSNSYVRMQHFVRRTTYVPFRRFLGGLRREFTQRLSAALHGSLGSYFRDALHEGSVDVVACLHVPRA